ncbi:Cell division control protein 48 homolog C [Linum grandiflorum]
MVTGRRFGGGGGRNLLKLRKDVDACRGEFFNADDIIQHLRHQFPNYRRMAHQSLAKNVRQIFEAPPSSSLRQKRSRTDESEEELLQQMQGKRVRKISANRSSESSVCNSDSNSEYAEPEFDLMRSMLRDSYAPEKNIEVEAASSSKDKDRSNRGKGKALSSDSMEVKDSEDQGPTFDDFGGLEKVLDELETDVLMPLYYPHLLKKLGVRPVSGILLHGPPGCGKTKLARAIANETGVPFYQISATEAVSGVSGASEEYIRELFSKAYRTAPSIIFIDEIDAIGSKRENLQREMERRIVTQLMTCMDEYHKQAEQRSSYVLVIAATNRPDAIDSALRRPGRFDREIMLGVPDEDARVQILSVVTSKCTLEGSLDLSQIARLTPGFVGADLDALSSKAGNLALRRVAALKRSTLSSEELPLPARGRRGLWKTPWSDEEVEKLAITNDDFEKAAKLVQPSLTREGFSSVPNVTWEDVGGLEKIRNALEDGVVRSPKKGILLFGPPGCGKTLIAKAAAHESGANFIHVKGPELLNKYVGESELAVRNLFTRARHCAPCIIFMDEVDALMTDRAREGGWVVSRLVNQLLIELQDGADQRQGVFVIGATNRPEVIDPALLRPGRLGKHVLVSLPSAEDRCLILKTLARGMPLDPSVDLDAIGRMEACENLSGADLNQLMEDAAEIALKEASKTRSTKMDKTCRSTINMSHFEQALKQISPSVTRKQVRFYETWAEKISKSS